MRELRAKMRVGRARWLAVGVLGMLLLESGALTLVPLMRAQAGITLTGTFTAVYGDPAAGGALPARDSRYFVTDTGGTNTELLIDRATLTAAGGVPALVGQKVVVSAVDTITPRNTGIADGARVVTAIGLAPGITPRLQPRTAVSGSQPYLNLLCKFSDVAAETQPHSYFDSLMSDGPNSIGAFWNEASYGQIDIHGSQSVGWVTLPLPLASYVNNGSWDLSRTATDCIAAASAAVLRSSGSVLDFAPYRGLNIIVNSTVGCCAWGGDMILTLNGVTRAWPITWLVPWAYSAAGGGYTAMAHEMGHAFGLRHSSDSAGNVYFNDWDVMSGDWDYCGSVSATPYGCPPQHQIAYDKDSLGWIPAGRKVTYNGVSRRVVLGQLADMTTGGAQLVVIPHAVGNTTTYTTVEMRHRQGFDAKLPGDAVLIHEVNTARSEPAYVQGTIIQTGHGLSDGTTGAEFTDGMTYTVPGAGVTITVQSISADRTQAVIVLSNGAPPQVTAMSQTTSPERQTSAFTLTGTNLSPDTRVTFGTTPGTMVWNSATSLTVTAPALAGGTYTVTVTNPDGLTGNHAYTYVTTPAFAPVLHATTGVSVPTPLSQPNTHAVPTPIPAPPLSQPTRH